MTDSLDPEDWQGFRKRAHAMLDAALDRMETYREGRVWNPPEDTLKVFHAPDQKASGAEATDAALQELFSYGVGNTHPRFFGWVHGAGTPANLMADITAATLNANCGGRNHAAIELEKRLIDWCLAQFNFPKSGSGLITTGTSMATVIALKAARDHALDFESRNQGLKDLPKLTGYTSEGAHNCIARAFDLLGLGSIALRKVPIDQNGQMDTNALRAAIHDDRKAGYTPFLICATAGTVNTGSIDPLDEAGQIARAEGIWFHVDAAFAAALQFSDAHRGKLAGIEKAHSLAFDFHKWMQVNYDAGCVLIRNGDSHRRSFSDRPDYLSPMTRGLAAGNPWPVEYGPELSRGFRALKVWAQLHEFGTEELAAVVERNISQAAYLAERVRKAPELELLSYAGLNICCFRFDASGKTGQEADAMTEEIVTRLQEEGTAAPSTTRIDGKLAIRVNITNHRTQMSDIDVLVDGVLEIGRELQG
ncbi:pyridoxal phosphate-dependent decarboxylase family protein [Ponticaulis profundi]|uniref:Pyridoxal phosphate-dependent decarboxylase family protein n=1 Tax=Ponticaulis profundi TaxID=2665222 RepID=A0ABW1S7Q2_9PROT